MEWAPLSSRDFTDLEHAENNGDFFYGWKDFANRQKLPLFGANYGHEVTLVLLDTALIKDFIQKQ